MKRRILIRSLSILIVVLLLNSVSFAATESSHYLSAYTAYITKSGNTVLVNFEIQGTEIMDQVGVTQIYLYERPGTSGSWTLVATFLSSDPVYSSAMMGSCTNLHYDNVTYSGSASKQYFAYVTCYAEKNGGSDSRSFSTAIG